MLPTFRNEPFTDFSIPANVAAFQQAIDYVRSQLGQKYPMRIGANEVWAEDTLESTNPARPSEVVGIFPNGRKEDAERALQVAEEAFKTWQYTDAITRTRSLL